MALGYKLTITDEKGGEIIISTMEEDTNNKGKNDIICASYKSDTINNNAMTRDNSIRTEILIFGAIDKDNKEDICNLAEWANETNSDLYYRNVKLEIYESTSVAEPFRTYEVNKMFVLDYTEGFEMPTERFPERYNDKYMCNYELVLVQKDGNYKKSVYSD